jgi:hypothetical protein
MMESILDKREVSLARVGPRELKDPRSREYAIQTLYSLKRVSEMLRCDHERVQKDIAEIEQYRHWEVLGYESKEAMFAAELSELGQTNVMASVEAAIAAGPVGAHGGDRKSEGAKDQGNIVPLKQRGNSPEAALRRLLREGRTDLVEQVRAGALSPHGAAVQAGFRKATWSAPVDEDDLERALAKRYPGWRFVRVT